MIRSCGRPTTGGHGCATVGGTPACVSTRTLRSRYDVSYYKSGRGERGTMTYQHMTGCSDTNAGSRALPANAARSQCDCDKWSKRTMPRSTETSESAGKLVSTFSLHLDGHSDDSPSTTHSVEHHRMPFDAHFKAA